MTSSSDKQYPRIGVGVIILKGRSVLLGKRKGPRGSGLYGLPGGFLEKNESFKECAEREVFEETGLKGLTLHPICLISGYTDSIHYTDIIFYSKHEKGEPTTMEKNRAEKWEWFNIYRLPKPLYSPTELALNNFTLNYRLHKIKSFVKKWLPGIKSTLLFLDSIDSKSSRLE